MRKLLIGISLLAVLVAGAVYTGLANPLIERQVEGTLVKAGIAENRAECMAERMVDRLTISQLWQLRQAMAPLEDEPEDGYSLAELVKRFDRLADGEAVAVLTTSAALCVIGIG